MDDKVILSTLAVILGNQQMIMVVLGNIAASPFETISLHKMSDESEKVKHGLIQLVETMQ